MASIKRWGFLLGICYLLFMSYFLVSHLYAAESVITDSEGYACMGDDKSRKQTEEAAMAEAKRKAVENVTTYIKSETRVKDFLLEKDIVEAYARAAIRVVQETEKGWYKDTSAGECYRMKLKAEVLPDQKALDRIAKEVTEDPSLPLNVQLWVDKKEYRQGDRIKIYLKGNKPFYARVIYRDATGNAIQLLPNPFRGDDYFNGGVVYEIPAGQDRFELEVAPPFGQEKIFVYASPSPLGDIALEPKGGVYMVKSKEKDIGIRTRGINLVEKAGGKKVSASEFYEGLIELETRK